MPIRTTPFANDYFYHIYNRGVEKRITYLDDRDFNHFLKILNYYKYSGPKPSFSKTTEEQLKSVEKNEKIVEIICYCLMPNHFHLLLKQLKEGGISEFMRKISDGHTRYFNTKHRRVGPLFQGAFKAVLIESDEQLVHVSRYIHLNPVVSLLVKDLKSYKWSSYYNYIGIGDSKLIGKDEILNFFKDIKEYERFCLDQISYGIDLERIKHKLLDGEE